MQKIYFKQSRFISSVLISCTIVHVVLGYVYNSCLYRIVVNIIQHLLGKLFTLQFFLLVILPSKLVTAIATIYNTGFPENVQHPIPPVFQLFVCNFFNDLLTCRLFKITEYFTDIIVFCTKHLMDMITHDTQGMYH